MLTETLVEELTRSTPLQQRLVELAWPALSAESRLQVLAQSQEMPPWLLSLALSDEQPIVRYWGAKRAPPSPNNVQRAAYGLPPESDHGLTARIAEDSCDLVRAHADDLPFLEATQLSRLARVRAGAIKGDCYADWMIRALDAGLSDQEVEDFAVEVFERPQVKRELLRAEAEPFWDEGYSDYLNGKDLDALWKLLGRGGPKLRRYLLWRIPFKYRGHSVYADSIARLPIEALAEVISAHRKQPAVRQAVENILKWPDNYPAEKRKKVQELEERLGASMDSSTHHTKEESQSAELAQSLLWNEVAGLREELVGLRRILADALARSDVQRKNGSADHRVAVVCV